ncbi:methylated-DNA--[protein]-cysteine S-methyltransferase [Dactylosporangium matsuzakiense]|uniref:Methylated-DNA--protein-cysteine methyltransferase n=1 Tax=Dactylosporangium matsuzakiense TaxID=53360 RepID=A0A9W6KBM4_9ACTN|nr:methylated-DNA--[protein]-cysteine S-methyltransferase [Dactylosporangium matsuzakiense]GLK99101.1 methylated-DNA--protein-cysteine methyltransferase [Dactylosporangium matsuzakiense]
MQAPIDALGVAADESGICRVQFGGMPPNATAVEPDELLAQAADELTRYFAGEDLTFTVPLSVRGGSQFERAVWRQLYAVPYAEMRTYGQIAAAVGDPDAARAVGTACNRNPIPVIIPCHRVVGADGKMVGFGGGLWRKKILLELEARVRIEREFGLQ